ncbi:unnamed protein product, partial [Meganyctiphanes norvegica]
REGKSGPQGDYIGDVNGRYYNDFPMYFESKSNQVSISFTSSRFSGKGFILNWFSNKDCGSSNIGNGGYIEYPESTLGNYYPGNVTCIWSIITVPGAKIELDFWKFDVAPNDKLLIREYNNSELIEVGIYDKDNLPKMINSSSNHMLLQFTSDNYSLNQGFAINWERQSG